jgi:hypothetical protein
MIQFQESIADAYVMPRRNVAMPSMPGRQVKFLQGHATIKDGRDLVAMMRRPDVQIILTEYALSWLEVFLKEVGENLRADVMWPERLPAPEPEPPASNWDPSYRGTDSPEPGT